MNTVNAQSPVADLLGMVTTQPAIPGAASGDSQFKAMLEGAIQQQTPQESQTNAQAEQSQKTGSSPGAKDKAQTPAPAEEPDATTASVAAVIVQQPQPQGQELVNLLGGVLEEEVVEAVTGEGTAAGQAMEQLLETVVPTGEEAVPTPPQQLETPQPVIVQEEEVSREIPVVDIQVEGTPRPEELAPELPQLAVRPVNDQENQQRFDEMVTQATEALGKEEELPAAHEEPYQVPLELQAKLPEENLNKQEQPPVVRVTEKSVRSSAQKDIPEEELLAIPDQRPESAVRVETKPAETEMFRSRPVDQIETRILENLEQEKMEFRMQLNPQELGRVDVKMVLESGRLTVEIMAHSAKTAELLTKQTEGLAASLRVSGVDLQTVQVVTGTENQNSHMEQSLSMMMGQPGDSGEQQENGSGRGSNSSGTAQAMSPEDGKAAVKTPQTLLDKAV